MTSHVFGSLHGLLNSGALPDPLAGDLATLSRNLHIARLSQQQQL